MSRLTSTTISIKDGELFVSIGADLESSDDLKKVQDDLYAKCEEFIRSKRTPATQPAPAPAPRNARGSISDAQLALIKRAYAEAKEGEHPDRLKIIDDAMTKYGVSLFEHLEKDEASAIFDACGIRGKRR